MHAYGLIKVMPPRQSHLPQDRSTYIPPRIQQEINQHMQKTLPANLQYYQKSGGYVPPNIQQQMAQHMQSTMPEHLKQYINPYMQQNVVSQHLASAAHAPSPNFTPAKTPSFLPNQKRLDPFQATSEHLPPSQLAFSQTPQTSQPTSTEPPQVTTSPEAQYAFITNPDVPVKRSSSLLTLLSGKSLMTRIAVIGGGLVVLLVVISVLRGLVSGSFNLQPFLVVLQDQQELIHITSDASQPQSGQPALPANYQNFLATTKLTVTSAQEQLLIYLAKNNQKVNTAELRYNTSIDSQLTTAESNDTYTLTFQQIMNSQLDTYKTNLVQAYDKTSGKKGRAQLRSDYNQLKLLIKQFNQANNVPSN